MVRVGFKNLVFRLHNLWRLNMRSHQRGNGVPVNQNLARRERALAPR